MSRTEVASEFVELLDKLGFVSHPEKPGLWQRDCEDSVVAYVDFRKSSKGRRFYTREGEIFDSADDVQVLVEFKHRRDRLLAEATGMSLDNIKADESGNKQLYECKDCGRVLPREQAEEAFALYDEILCEVCVKPPVPAPSIKPVQEALTLETIKQYINPNVSDQEAYTFLQLCRSRNLNPFVGEAHLIKYGSQPATMVVGKDAFTKRAEEHPAFDGFEAGIIVEKDGMVEHREGTFHTGEKLLGGWAKVYRRDRSHAFVSEVALSEYSTGKSSWQKIPATMIRKVALVQALREAFPSKLGGLYDACERSVEVVR